MIVRSSRFFSSPPTLSAWIFLRPLSSTASRAAKQSAEAVRAERKTRALLKKKDPEAMSIPGATAILKAVEVGSPNSAYELSVLTHFVRGQAAHRGKVSLPRDPRTKAEVMLVFAEGRQARAAIKAGATYVGGVELVDDVLSGAIAPTKVLCTPALLPQITPKLARFLGPKGLMPAMRRGTVTDDIVGSVKASVGTLDWKGDKQGVVRVPIGRLTYPVSDLEKNIRAFLKNVRDATAEKESLVQKKKKSLPTVLRVFLSSRQGPGIPLADI